MSAERIYCQFRVGDRFYRVSMDPTLEDPPMLSHWKVPQGEHDTIDVVEGENIGTATYVSVGEGDAL